MLLHESEVKPHIKCTNNSWPSVQPAISSNETFWWEGRPPITIQQSIEQMYIWQNNTVHNKMFEKENFRGFCGFFTQ